jgi:sialidase-1
MIIRPYFAFTIIAILSTLSSVSAGEKPLGIKAVVRQRIHPVLIRNDRNPLLELTIESERKDVFLHSLTFSLKGTDDLNDVESLQVFLAGDKQNYSTQATFGDRAKSAGEVVIRGNVRLRRGVNVLWLSCQLSPKASLTHKVDATCTKIETSVGDVTPQAETLNVRKRIGIALRRHFDDGVHTYRIAALATTPKGTLLCVYDMRRRAGRDLQEDIDIGLLRSTDGGQTWEPQRVIMDMHEYGKLPQEQNGCSDPGILVDPATGEIFVTAVWTWGRPGTHQWNKGGSEPGFEIGKTAQFLMVRSKDDGRSFSKPENMTRKLKQKEWILFAPSPQQGISLPDGTLVMPGQGRDEQDRHFSNLIISRDHGKTWTLSNPASFGNTECQAVLLGNGSIMLNCRSERPTKFRTVAVTSDLGKTWKPHTTNRNTLIEPNCNGSTYRFDYKQNGEKKHILVFANPHTQAGRDHHTIQISFDDGRTWPKEYHLLLDVGRGAGYPSLSRVDEGHIALVYEGSQSQLVFEKFSLDELLTRRK